MNFLEEKIVKNGIVKEGNVLKVDSFLNHQMDIELFNEMGKEWKKRFEWKNINKILTIEASGIGIGFTAASEIGLWHIFPEMIQNVFAANVVAVVFVASIILNLILPKNMEVEKISE